MIGTIAGLLVKANELRRQKEDPENPWPRGSTWWRKHNEMYRRAQAASQRDALRRYGR